jgi:hypothetical protein
LLLLLLLLLRANGGLGLVLGTHKVLHQLTPGRRGVAQRRFEKGANHGGLLRRLGLRHGAQPLLFGLLRSLKVGAGTAAHGRGDGVSRRLDRIGQRRRHGAERLFQHRARLRRCRGDWRRDAHLRQAGQFDLRGDCADVAHVRRRVDARRRIQLKHVDSAANATHLHRNSANDD